MNYICTAIKDPAIEFSISYTEISDFTKISDFSINNTGIEQNFIFQSTVNELLSSFFLMICSEDGTNTAYLPIGTGDSIEISTIIDLKEVQTMLNPNCILNESFTNNLQLMELALGTQITFNSIEELPVMQKINYLGKKYIVVNKIASQYVAIVDCFDAVASEIKYDNDDNAKIGWGWLRTIIGTAPVSKEYVDTHDTLTLNEAKEFANSLVDSLRLPSDDDKIYNTESAITILDSDAQHEILIFTGVIENIIQILPTKNIINSRYTIINNKTTSIHVSINSIETEILSNKIYYFLQTNTGIQLVTFISNDTIIQNLIDSVATNTQDILEIKNQFTPVKYFNLDSALNWTGIASSETMTIACASNSSNFAKLHNGISELVPVNTSANFTDICYNPVLKEFIACAKDSSTFVKSSNNGNTWQIVGVPSQACEKIVSCKGYYFVMCSGDPLSNTGLFSDDGVTFTEVTLPISREWADVSCDTNGRLIMIPKEYSSNIAIHSYDGGKSWTTFTAGEVFNQNIQNISFIGNNWIMPKYNTNEILISKDATNWQIVTMPFIGLWEKPVSFNSRTYMLNSMGRDCFSIDHGLTWETFTLSDKTWRFVSLSNGQWYFIESNNQEVATVIETFNVGLVDSMKKTFFTQEEIINNYFDKEETATIFYDKTEIESNYDTSIETAVIYYNKSEVDTSAQVDAKITNSALVEGSHININESKILSVETGSSIYAIPTNEIVSTTYYDKPYINSAFENISAFDDRPMNDFRTGYIGLYGEPLCFVDGSGVIHQIPVDPLYLGDNMQYIFFNGTNGQSNKTLDLAVELEPLKPSARMLKWDVNNWDCVIGEYVNNISRLIYISHYDATKFNQYNTKIPVYYYNNTTQVIIGYFNKRNQYEHTTTEDSNFQYHFAINTFDYITEVFNDTTYGRVAYREVESLRQTFHQKSLHPWCCFIEKTEAMENLRDYATNIVQDCSTAYLRREQSESQIEDILTDIMYLGYGRINGIKFN